jgi:hypothetical protein
MSDFLYIVGKGAEFKEGLDVELVDDIRANFSGVYPHTFLARIRVVVRDSHGGVSIEPLALHKKVYGDVLASIVNWISHRAESVVVRLEGHRGALKLPDVERRTGTIDDVLKFRRRGRDPYLIEFEID